VSERPARSRAFTREVWLDGLARFPHSGLTPAQFCALEAVSLPSFYAWKRRLAAEVPGLDHALARGVGRGPRLLPVRLTSPVGRLPLTLPPGAGWRFPRLSSLASS
jgi:hypothetical protein